MCKKGVGKLLTQYVGEKGLAFGDQENDHQLSLQNESIHCQSDFGQDFLYCPSRMYSHSKGTMIMALAMNVLSV